MPVGDRRPRIAVIGCGGTIASLAADPLDVIDYPESGRKIGIEELLARVPEVVRFADIVAHDVCTVSSSAIGPREWLQLRREVLRLVGEGAQGVVITHGTGTLEETAFFLHLTLALDVPVVLTGAQRPLSAQGSDAPANLIAAVRVAAAPQARGLGVLVVLNDEIHSAAQVVKTSTYRLQTFQSPEYGPLGHADGDDVILRRVPLQRAQTFHPDVAGADETVLPPVHIVYSYAGAEGAPIRAAVAAGARGVVSAGFAPGIPTPGEAVALDEARQQGVVVVQASRALSGRVAPRQALRARGVIAAQDLSPQKARILLMLCLGAQLDEDEIAQRFTRMG